MSLGSKVTCYTRITNKHGIMQSSQYYLQAFYKYIYDL